MQLKPIPAIVVLLLVVASLLVVGCSSTKTQGTDVTQSSVVVKLVGAPSSVNPFIVDFKIKHYGPGDYDPTSIKFYDSNGNLISATCRESDLIHAGQEKNVEYNMGSSPDTIKYQDGSNWVTKSIGTGKS